MNPMDYEKTPFCAAILAWVRSTPSQGLSLHIWICNGRILFCHRIVIEPHTIHCGSGLTCSRLVRVGGIGYGLVKQLFEIWSKDGLGHQFHIHASGVISTGKVYCLVDLGYDYNCGLRCRTFGLLVILHQHQYHQLSFKINQFTENHRFTDSCTYSFNTIHNSRIRFLSYIIKTSSNIKSIVAR